MQEARAAGGEKKILSLLPGVSLLVYLNCTFAFEDL